MAHTHSHSHGHGHHHGHHHHAPSSLSLRFGIGIVLNFLFVIAEFFYGQLSGSLALVADAGHNLSDVLSLVLALGATMLAKRLPTPDRTYGMRRSSILAALINAVILLSALGAIAWEAIRRLGNPSPVGGMTVVWVAAAGIAINLATALLFHSGKDADLNVRGAFLHMMADALVSAGVVVGGLVMLKTGWTWLDPVLSLAIVAIIFGSTWQLLRDSVNLALDAVPVGVDVDAIKAYLIGLPEVVDMHDLHVWGVSTTETALTAHLVVAGPDGNDALILRTERELHDRFGIEHATLQLESEQTATKCRCRLMPAGCSQ